MKSPWVVLSLILAMTFGIWLNACNTETHPDQQLFSLENPDDLLKYDQVVIVLSDTLGGKVDTLYDKHPEAASDFSNLAANAYSDEVVRIWIQGYQSDHLVYEKILVINTSTQTLISTELTRIPKPKIVLADPEIFIEVGEVFTPPSAQLLPLEMRLNKLVLTTTANDHLQILSDSQWQATLAGEAKLRWTWETDPAIYAEVSVHIQPETQVPPEDTAQSPDSLRLKDESISVYLGGKPLAVAFSVIPPNASRNMRWVIADSEFVQAEGELLRGVKVGMTQDGEKLPSPHLQIQGSQSHMPPKGFMNAAQGYCSALSLSHLNHSLTAPRVMPRKRLRRIQKVRAMGGRAETKPAAAIGPQGTWVVSAEMACTRTGRVMASMLVKVRAKVYSFQEERKHNTAVADRPGKTCGITAQRKACIRVYPSRRADSSKAGGISSKKLFIIHVDRERFKVV